MKAGKTVPSGEQDEAIRTSGNVLVRAGAGSGKTEVLARRFVALIAGEIDGHQRLGPEQVAAITFTEKATYDMRGRIATVLDEGIGHAASDDLRAHLRRAKKTLALARISTIHAFCARILRENAIEAGLDPNFDVIDEYESLTFITRVCERTMVDAVRKGDPGAIHLAGWRRLRQLGFREGAIEIATRVVREMRRMGLPPQWIVEQAEQTEKAIRAEAGDVARMAQELCKLVDGIVSRRGLTGETAADVASLKKVWPQKRNAISGFNAKSEPAAIEVFRDLQELLPAARADAVKVSIKAIRDLAGNVSTVFGLGGKLISAWGAQRSLGLTLDVAKLMANAAESVEQECRSERVVTFDDLLVRTRDLLKGANGVAERYRRQLRALLVDEYQDTDPVQDEIVELISRPGRDGYATELFIVGDEKQSIYRFRGADVTVFNRARQPAPRPMPLRTNRRSTPNILNFVNAVGESAMIRKAQEDDDTDSGSRAAYWIEWSEEHVLKHLREASFNPPVELITEIAGKGSVAERREQEARALARWIRDFIDRKAEVVDAKCKVRRPAEFGDIAILLRAFTDVAIYERALVEAGIDCYTVKGRGFFGCTEILDITELLAAVNDPRDSLALAAALRSPLFALSDRTLFEMALRIRDSDGRPANLAHLFDTPVADFEWLSEGRPEATRAWQVLKELRAMRSRLPIVEVIERAIALTDFEAVILGLRQGRQRVANVRKLVELARTFDAHRFFTFHDFITHLRQLTVEPPMEPQAQILSEGENVVRLMTVHQAKGLEFPVVIVADAGRKEPIDNNTPVLDKEWGLLIHDAIGSGRFEPPHALIDRYRKRIRDEEKAESARILYVALTRARDYLVVSEGADNKGWRAAIRDAVGADIVKKFVTSGRVSEKVAKGDLQIVLRRPQTEQWSAKKPVGRGTSDGKSVAQLARTRLHFVADVSHELVISPTALGDFDRCPLQFHFRHGLGLPEGNVGTAGNGDAAAMGTVAHAILERLDFQVRGVALRPEIVRMAEALGGANGLDAKQRGEIVEDLVGYVSGLNGADAAMRREIPFFMKVDDGMFVRGQIDVLVDDGRTITVRDYKYALAGEPRAYQVQMECYALAAGLANPRRRVEAEIVFIRNGAVRTPVELPDADEIRSRLRALGRGVIDARERGEYAKKPANASECRALRCGYVARCWGN